VTDAEAYVVEVKPSARKVSAVAGAWVRDNGTSRRFESKALAKAWARRCAGPHRAVWIQDAVPWDESRADGYLVGARRRPGETSGLATHQADLEME
jgi:hypothetical protein